MADLLRNVRRVRGARSTVEVYERGDYRCLRFAGGGGLVQGRMHLQRPLDFGSAYLAPLCAATLAVAEPRHALCLGLGVGAVPRLLRAMWPELKVDAVEIDPAVITAARTYFGLETGPALRVVEADAAAFVERPPPGPAYDLVVIDCYDGQAIPEPLTRPLFFRRAVDLLAAGGVLAANVVTTRRGAGAVATALAGVLEGPHIMEAEGRSNRVWFGGRTGRPDGRQMRRRAVIAERRVPLALMRALRRMRPVG